MEEWCPSFRRRRHCCCCCLCVGIHILRWPGKTRHDPQFPTFRFADPAVNSLLYELLLLLNILLFPSNFIPFRALHSAQATYGRTQHHRSEYIMFNTHYFCIIPSPRRARTRALLLIIGIHICISIHRECKTGAAAPHRITPTVIPVCI